MSCMSCPIADLLGNESLVLLSTTPGPADQSHAIAQTKGNPGGSMSGTDSFTTPLPTPPKEVNATIYPLPGVDSLTVSFGNPLLL